MTRTAEMTVDLAQTLVFRRWLVGVLLLLSVLVSAVGVIYVSHINRQLFRAYQEVLNYRDEMEVEWGQLLLEQSALAAHARIERVAAKRLGMRVPEADEIVMVER